MFILWAIESFFCHFRAALQPLLVNWQAEEPRDSVRLQHFFTQSKSPSSPCLVFVCAQMCVHDIVLWGRKPSRQPCLLAGKHSWTSDYCLWSPGSNRCQPIAHKSVTPDALCVFTCASACVCACFACVVCIRLRALTITNIGKKRARHPHSCRLLIHSSELHLSMGNASSWHCSILWLAAVPSSNTWWQHVHAGIISSASVGLSGCSGSVFTRDGLSLSPGPVDILESNSLLLVGQRQSAIGLSENTP